MAKDILTEFFPNARPFFFKDTGRSRMVADSPNLLLLKTKNKFYRGHGKNKMYQFRTVSEKKTKNFITRIGDIKSKSKFFGSNIYRTKVSHKRKSFLQEVLGL